MDSTAFEKWKGFIDQLATVYLIVTPREEARLNEELAVIERTQSVAVFQAVYDAWYSLALRGVKSYLTGEAEKWYIFYFLSMTRENPIENEPPSVALLEVGFDICK